MSSGNKAAWLEGAGKPYYVADCPLDMPGEGEVRVRQRYIAVGGVEWAMSKFYPFADHSPSITGVDIAGDVDEVGPGVTTIKKGQTVIGHGSVSLSKNDKHGSLQLRPIVPIDKLTTIPGSISLESVAGLPLSMAAAASSLFAKMFCDLEKPQVGTRSDRSKDVVFITGGSSTVGCAAVQLATLAGYSVVATCSTHNFDLVKRLGAKAVVDRKSASCGAQSASKIKETGTLKAVVNCTEPSAIYTILDTLKTLEQPDFPVVTVSYAPEEFKENPPYKHVFAFSLGMWMEGWGASFWSEYIVPAIESGEFQPAPHVEIAGTSLEDINRAVEKYSEGVSGVKLVVKIP